MLWWVVTSSITFSHSNWDDLLILWPQIDSKKVQSFVICNPSNIKRRLTILTFLSL